MSVRTADATRRQLRSSTPAVRWTGPWYRYWARDPADEVDEVQAGALQPSTTVLPEATPTAGSAPMFHVKHRQRLTTGRAPVLTVANQKGGVGKTTTAVSLAAAVAEGGYEVLLVDLDPQGNATSGVGLHVSLDSQTVYDVLVSNVDFATIVLPTEVPRLSVAPANLDLAGAEIELVSHFNRERQLRLALESIREEFDLILIDCPPSLGLLTVNALSACDGVIVPIQCEYFALEGLGALRRNTDLIRSQLNPHLEIVGFVLTMLDARTRLSQQVVDEVRAHFGDLVFDTRVPRSIRLAEAPGFGQPITVFDPSSRGAMAYRRLASEVLERVGAGGRLADPLRQGVS